MRLAPAQRLSVLRSKRLASARFELFLDSGDFGFEFVLFGGVTTFGTVFDVVQVVLFGRVAAFRSVDLMFQMVLRRFVTSLRAVNLVLEVVLFGRVATFRTVKNALEVVLLGFVAAPRTVQLAFQFGDRITGRSRRRGGLLRFARGQFRTQLRQIRLPRRLLQGPREGP